MAVPDPATTVLEGWTMLVTLAAVTQRVTLDTLVLATPELELLVGGAGSRTIDLAVRKADWWNARVTASTSCRP